MIVTTTSTTTTTTALTSNKPMSLSSNPETNSILPNSFMSSAGHLNAAMQPFTPGQCLFCPNSSPSFTDSMAHMQRSHGLFIPYQQHLIVELESLFGYLHLVIFGYRECIQCGAVKTTVQAVQHHMTGKGHCRFDISEQESEFADFYEFSETEDDLESDIKADGDESIQAVSISSSRKKVLAIEDSIRLPSGKIISRQSSKQAEGPSFTKFSRQTRKSFSQREYSLVKPNDDEGFSKEKLDLDTYDTRLLSKKERRERATLKFQLANMSANDRHGLMHLCASQQRSILATQHRHDEKVQKEERRRQSKIDRKGNKNLYAYWATETPVYQCG